MGAHEGEENDAYLAEGIKQNDIFWVEAHPSLCYRLSSRLPNVIQAAVSDRVEQVMFHVTNNYQSSSFLELKEHLVEHPHIHTIDTLRLSTSQLDSVVETNSIRANFLNLDIQGAELKCLKGFEEHIQMIDYIYTEVNTKELYEGCGLLGEMDEWLSARGFERKEISMTPHGWGDAFYIRQRKVNWLLVDRYIHAKNKLGFLLMAKEPEINLTISNNPEEFAKEWDLVYVPSSFIDPADFPRAAKIIYGPHNFVFVEGVWKRGNYTFPQHCSYNILCDWVDELQEVVGGLSLVTKTLPFPIDLDKFNPRPDPIEYDCFLYFKNRHSDDFTHAMNEVVSRNLTYKTIVYGSYSEEDFLQTIRSSKFGIWVGSHESQGFALEECLATNKPLLVWDSASMFDEHQHGAQTYNGMVGTYALRATTHPYWDETCGISFTEKEDLGLHLDKMLETYEQFQPRGYIERTLSAAACVGRFRSPDLFMITSTINTGSVPWSYAPRSVYSPEERRRQTIETIESIRSKVPTAKIMLVECSDVSLASMVDYFVDLTLNDEVRRACLESHKKGFGEALLTKHALEYIFKNEIDFERLFKISGRYSLNYMFCSTSFSNTEFTFKKSSHDSISTVLFSVPCLHVKKFYNIIASTADYYYSTNGATSYETIVPQNCLPRKDISTVGAQGYVAVTRGVLVVA